MDRLGSTRRAILAVLSEWKADDLQGDLGGDWFQPNAARDLIILLSDKCMNYKAEEGFHVRAQGTQTCLYRVRKSIEHRLCQKAGSSVLFFTHNGVVFALINYCFTTDEFDHIISRIVV